MNSTKTLYIALLYIRFYIRILLQTFRVLLNFSIQLQKFRIRQIFVLITRDVNFEIFHHFCHILSDTLIDFSQFLCLLM